MGPTNTTKRGGGSKWVLLGGLVLAVLVAVEAGWAGFGWAQLRSAIFPRDESLLAWVPGDTAAVVIVDPHQIKLEALGAENGTVRATLQRARGELRKVTGVDLGFDVDKLVLTSSLAVLRGRFDPKKVAERLMAHHYVAREHEGKTYLARAGEDAIAVIDGSILLYGDEPGLLAGITAHAKGTSLEKDELATARLRRIGWNHAMAAVGHFHRDQPSVREILKGGPTGPRALAVSLTTQSGVDVHVQVEGASPANAEDLATLLKEKQKQGDLGPMVTDEAAKILLDVAKKATITLDSEAGVVTLHAHLDAAQIDALAKRARHDLPVGEMYKTVRLFQLLMPDL